MPELPEVETIVRDLKLKVLQRAFNDLWTDAEKLVKFPKDFGEFKKSVIGLKIKNVSRRGKNIIFDLSKGKVLLIHQKMTGHLLLGKWEKAGSGWKAAVPGPIAGDPMNRFLHLIFSLDNGQMLALSDVRKFAKVELRESKDFYSSKYFNDLGPEPLDQKFSLEKFKARLRGKKGKIKQVLMDQGVIAGIGNIYADEILWQAKISPFRPANKISGQEMKLIYSAMKEILKKAIKAKGSSMSDYRTLSGEKGKFQLMRKVYRRAGEKCPACGGKIKREVIGGRSAHFCPNCQK
jgi:formamidopyrimidine-DNA glycosylase